MEIFFAEACFHETVEVLIILNLFRGFSIVKVDLGKHFSRDQPMLLYFPIQLLSVQFKIVHEFVVVVSYQLGFGVVKE